jgi:hypothetical protein
MSKNNRNFSNNKSILYNQGVLYFIFILALGHLFYILTTGDFFTLSIFVIIGFLTSFFSKNMVVILSLAMSVSFIFKFGTKIQVEGFEENLENTTSTAESDTSTAEIPPPPSTPIEEIPPISEDGALPTKKQIETMGAMLTSDQKDDIATKLAELNLRLKA